MIAAPIIAGRLYRVRGRGMALVVIAPDACTAIAIGAERILGIAGDTATNHPARSLPCAA